jgi:hypothetical protein
MSNLHERVAEDRNWLALFTGFWPFKSNGCVTALLAGLLRTACATFLVDTTAFIADFVTARSQALI